MDNEQKEKKDVLCFIRGAYTGSSKFTVEGKPIKNYDKTKILKRLRLMPQIEFDEVFNQIEKLKHHEDTTVGLLATDLTIEKLASTCGINDKQGCYTFLDDIMFEISPAK